MKEEGAGEREGWEEGVQCEGDGTTLGSSSARSLQLLFLVVVLTLLLVPSLRDCRCCRHQGGGG